MYDEIYSKNWILSTIKFCITAELKAVILKHTVSEQNGGIYL